jgi:ubiquinone/menaquinone biosynthesis C-methylase UbiE
MSLLSALPNPVLNVLRSIRTAAFWLLGSLESSSEVANSPRPPLWLRRHTGRVPAIEGSAAHATAFIQMHGLVAFGDTVLDAGSGFGVMAPHLSKLIGPGGTYVGFDSHGPSVRWTQRNIAALDRRFRFVLTRHPGASNWFPLSDRQANLLLAKSFFTHLPEALARQALQETARVLRPEGRALVTVFLFEHAASVVELLPYGNSSSTVRWKWKSRPEAAIAYERLLFGQMVSDAGLCIESFVPGFWPGSNHFDAQDLLVLTRDNR